MSQSVLSLNRNSNNKTSNKVIKGSSSTNLPNQANRKGLGSSSLRQSTGNLATQHPTMGVANNEKSQDTTDIRRIEAEYIRNLQQQVYFLELEANFLREQARKSTELQPQMTAEAKRMIGKLQELNAELNTARTDVKVLESTAEMYREEGAKIEGKLKTAEESHQKEKKLLMEEIVELKKEKEALERSEKSNISRLADVEHQVELSIASAQAAENKARLLETQLSEKDEQVRLLQQSLEDKRVECLRTEDRLRQTEEKYYNSIIRATDRTKDDLKDEEIRLLKQRLKDYEMTGAHDRHSRNKSEDVARLMKENTILSQQLVQLKVQLEKSDKKVVRNGTVVAGWREEDSGPVERPRSSASLHSASLEAQLRSDLDRARDQLIVEQGKVKHYIEQLSKLEDQNKSQQLSESTLRSKIAELTALNNNADTDNEKLRQDKDNLIQHIDQLQKQLDEKQTTIVGLRNKIHSLETRVKELEHLRDLQSNIQSQKWEEFSRLAESMKALSKSMAAKPGTKPSQWTSDHKPDTLDFS